MSIITLHPGAAGDQTTLLQQALNAASAAGGGQVLLEAGVYRTRTIHLRSRVHIQLAAGAVWQGSDRIEDYERLQSPITSRMDSQPWAVFISGVQIEDVVIEGPGTIDGNGDAASLRTGCDNDPRRPYGLHLVGCTNVTLRNLTLRNSAFWLQRYHGCRNLRLQGLTVWNHANCNNDGVDIDGCSDVTISDCVFDTADDALCLKSEGPLPTRNVVISNCRVASFASAFKLGTGSLSGFENIALSNCLFHQSQSPRRGHHQLPISNGISAIDFGSVDGGYLRDVTVSNCVVEGYLNLFNLRLAARHSRDLLGGQGYNDPAQDPRPIRHHSGAGLPPITHGTLEHIRLSGITAHGTGPIAANIVGYAGHPARHIALTDFDVRLGQAGVPADLDEPPNWDDKLYPSALAYTPLVPGVWPPQRWHGLPAYGLVLRHATDVTLRNYHVEPTPGEPRPCYYFGEGVARVRNDSERN